MADLADLKRRVAEATGPDRELDAAIMFDLFAKPFGKASDGGPVGYLWPEDNPSWNFGLRFPGKDRTWFAKIRARGDDKETLLIERDGALVLMNSLRVPRLTASLDATVSLVERVMPGWTWRVDGGHGLRPGSDLWLRPNEYYDGTGATPALALLSGLLAVLLANREPGA